MRGRSNSQVSVVCLFNLENTIPSTHPIRKVKLLADDVLRGLGDAFSSMYADTGRPSIPPERLLLASVLMALYSVRSERMFCERLRYDLLFRWFLDMGLDEEPFDPTSFGKNRERLIEHDVARQFFAAVVERARAEGLVSSEHFSVDGTLMETWASLKSFRPKDEPAAKDNNGWADFCGRRIAMACSSTCVTLATGHAERDAALQMVDALGLRDGTTLGADRGNDTADFIAACRSRGITPHVAQNTSKRRSAIDGRTTRWSGYAISLIKRRLIEQPFGWAKSVGGLRRSRLRGIAKTQLLVHIAGAAYNLLRVARLVQ